MATDDEEAFYTCMESLDHGGGVQDLAVGYNAYSQYKELSTTI